MTLIIEDRKFGIWDFVVFGGMLSISALIGIYYAFAKGGQKTTKDFLMGGKNMGILPVTLSLLASFMSAITLLGTPAEIYEYGISYVGLCLSYVIVIPAAAYFYLPVFVKMEVTSAYEYLERRFNKIIRRCGSAVFIIQMSVYMAIVMYAPALALSQVTGLSVWGSVSAISVVCTFYTTVGGIKAVMWTDAFQIIVMFGAMLGVIIKGCLDEGGFSAVWQISEEGGRIQYFDFSPNPLVRHSFWSLIFGGCFTWLAVYGVNQAQVQRYLTTPSIKTAQIALWWNLPGLIALLCICSFGGLVIYAKYRMCDPLKSEQIKTPDQLFPYFVMDTLGDLPGLPGFFVAGIFSGALSTVSSGLNSLSAVTLEDFVRPFYGKNMSERVATIISKSLAITYGVLCLALVAVAQQLGNVLQAALSIFGMVGGPLLGVFTLGIFFPCANSLGAGLGLLGSFALTFWIGFGAQIYKNSIHYPKSVISLEGCPANLTNATNTQTLLISDTTVPELDSDVVPVYAVSYLWYSAIACWTVIIIGLITSWISGAQDPEDLDPRLICPIFDKVCCCLPSSCRRVLRCGVGKTHQEPTTNGIATIEKNGAAMTEKNGNYNPAFDASDLDSTPKFRYHSDGEFTTSL